MWDKILQHSSSSWSIFIYHVQLGTEFRETFRSQQLREDINNLVGRRSEKSSNSPIQYTLVNEMAVNFYMFSLLMKHRIISNVDSFMVITVHS